MTLRYFIIPITFAAALAIGAAPASAQHGGGGHMGGGHSGGGQMHGGGGSFHGGGHHDSRGFDHRGAGRSFDGRHRFGGPSQHVRVIRLFRGPFFAFRPRFNLGFGLFVGYPVPYPWYYVAPYPYDTQPDGLTYGDPNDYDNSLAPSDEQRDYGGISFDITPGDATIFVDGIAVGAAQTFSPSSAPLTLVPGLHHVVIQKPGYQSATFDADVTEGQVIPYQGTMLPQ
jgi:hypothetical protein